MQDLGGSELEYDGVQRLIPAEQISCDQKDDAVSGKNIVPCLNAIFFRKENSDKVRAAAGGVGVQAEGDGAGIQNAAEYGDEQNIVRHLEAGENIRKETRQNDHQAGIAGEFFADIFKADKDRDGV